MVIITLSFLQDPRELFTLALIVAGTTRKHSSVLRTNFTDLRCTILQYYPASEAGVQY